MIRSGMHKVFSNINPTWTVHTLKREAIVSSAVRIWNLAQTLTAQYPIDGLRRGKLPGQCAPTREHDNVHIGRPVLTVSLSISGVTWVKAMMTFTLRSSISRGHWPYIIFFTLLSLANSEAEKRVQRDHTISWMCCLGSHELVQTTMAV
jgi:hypothetical protein